MDCEFVDAVRAREDWMQRNRGDAPSLILFGSLAPVI